MASQNPLRFFRTHLPSICRSCRAGTTRSSTRFQNGAVKLQQRNLSSLKSNGYRRPSAQFNASSRQQRRHFTIFDDRTKRYWAMLSHQHPVMLPVAVALVGGLAATTIVYLYGLFRIRLSMANYPEEVDMLIRQGVKFTDDKSLDPEKALKAWTKALNLALKKYSMHPLSEEVIFIYLRFAHSLEKFGLAPQAIDLLEDYKRLCIYAAENQFKDKPESRGDRTRVLDTAVKVSVQLGGLYAKPAIADRQKSEENLVWATETALKEERRRQEEGVKEGEGEWMDSDQMGATLESLGRHYEETDEHYFASQLFISALNHKASTNCHSVILMNNIAASIAQSLPPREPGMPPPSRAQLCDSAIAWATKSLEIARNIKPPTRDEECDVGCAVATHNLGEFAEMLGNIVEARDKYEEAMSLAHAIEFEEGVAAAEAGLQRLSAPKAGKTGAWYDDGKKKERSGWF